jgi:hypothetical protein
MCCHPGGREREKEGGEGGGGVERDRNWGLQINRQDGPTVDGRRDVNG